MNKSTLLSLFVFVTMILLLEGCSEKNVFTNQYEVDLIEEFMTSQGLDIEPTESGLYYKDIVEGTGELVAALDTVSVYYTGYYLSGIKFDGNVGRDPYTFVVNDAHTWVIAGWEEGLRYMRPGGEAIMIIPSWLAYGTMGYGTIPGYTPLFFEIELVEIRRGPNAK